MDASQITEVFFNYDFSLQMLEWMRDNKLLKEGCDIDEIAEQYAFSSAPAPHVREIFMLHQANEKVRKEASEIPELSNSQLKLLQILAEQTIEASSLDHKPHSFVIESKYGGSTFKALVSMGLIEAAPSKIVGLDTDSKEEQLYSMSDKGIRIYAFWHKFYPERFAYLD